MDANIELKLYLIRLAINRFGLQYKRKLKVDDFDAELIPPRVNTQVGYEIYSKKFSDYFRIRLYCTVDTYTDISPFILEENVVNVGMNGDEVYVAYAKLDNSFLYIDNNEVRRDFRNIYFDPSLLRVILTEDEDAVLTEDGFYIIQEDSE